MKTLSKRTAKKVSVRNSSTDHTRNRETEESEPQRLRDSNDTEETDDILHSGKRISSFQEAVAAVIGQPGKRDLLFDFARALKAMEQTTGRRLDSKDIDSAFNLFWSHCKGEFPETSDFDEFRFCFMDAFSKVRSPLGANHLERALHLARNSKQPEDCEPYSSPRLRLLIAVCYHLQVLVGQGLPFFISVRSVAKILSIDSTRQAAHFLNGLVADGILVCVEKGRPGNRKASRFKFRNQD